MLFHEHDKYKTKEDLQDLINILKRKGTYHLAHQMVRKVPHYEEMIAEQTFSYYYNGKREVIDIYRQACFKLRFLYIKNIPYEKYLFLNNWVRTNYIDAIQNDYLKPFLLFINGRCVPWDIIDIIFTNEDYYLIVESDDEKWNSMFNHMMKVDTIILQDGIEYITGEDLEVTEDTMFSFDDDGKLDTEHPTLIINNVGSMVSTVNYSTPYNYINAEPVIDKDDHLAKHRLQPDATIIFRNKLLDSASIAKYDHTLLTINGGNPGMEGDVFDCRIFVNKHSMHVVDNMARTDPIILQQYVRDKNLKGAYPSYLDDLDIKFGDQIYAYTDHEIHDLYEDLDHEEDMYEPIVDEVYGDIDEQSKLRFTLMQYGENINENETNNSENDDKKIIYGNNDKIKFSWLRYGLNDEAYTAKTFSEMAAKVIRRYSLLRYSINEGDPLKRILGGLEPQFWKDYETNLRDIVDTIINYNMWLFKWIYYVNSNLDILSVKGSYLIDRVVDGVFRIPRAHANGIQYCICLVNGELYKYSRSLKYKFNFWEIPIGNIQPDDDVELFFYKNVNNSIFDITLDENTPYEFVDDEYINNEMILFSDEAPDTEFDYPGKGLQHFPVDYMIDEDGEGKKKILVDEFYYGKTLKVAYKNQFRSVHYTVDNTVDGAYKVQLGTDFMYCNDYSKYMVFINGKRISSEHFRLVLPVRKTTPFYDFFLYITTPLNGGDRLDIYYLPVLMKDVEVMDTLRSDGVIHVRKSRINYPLSRDLYMVWVNGKKVPRDKLMDIDATHIRVIGNVNSTDTVCVTKYIEDFDYLTEFFQNNTSLWTRVMCQLSQEEICLLFNKTPEEVHNTDASIYENALPLTAVMWELIRDQYAVSPYVVPAEEFVYNYEDVDRSAMKASKRDVNGNVLFPAVDSHRTDVIDETRPWP